MPINLRLGLWLDDLRLGIKEGLKTIAPWRAEAIGLDAFGSELSPRSLSQSGRRDVANVVRIKGIALAALRADVGGRRLADSQSLDSNLTRIRDAMQLCSDVGARCLVVPAGHVPPADDKNGATARSTLTEAARSLALFVSGMGVRVCWSGGAETPETLKTFLNGVDSSGLLDVEYTPGALTMRGIDPLSALQPFAERIRIARATDHYQGGAEAPFGKGDVPWGAVLIGLSTLKQSEPIDLLAGCALDGDRVLMLANAYAKLAALRKNPV